MKSRKVPPNLMSARSWHRTVPGTGSGTKFLNFFIKLNEDYVYTDPALNNTSISGMQIPRESPFN